MNSILKQISFFTSVVLLSLAISFTFAAWQEPSSSPPDGNVSAPINISSTAQTKSGGLTLQGDFTAPIFYDSDNTDYYVNPAGQTVLAGNVGIGTTSPGAKLEVNGDVLADAFYYSSDESLKRDIKVLDNSLEKILELEGVSFDWKENGEASIGLIAQDVEKTFPEAVNENPETGIRSINYGVLVAPLIETVKEQQRQIELLEDRLEKLENHIY